MRLLSLAFAGAMVIGTAGFAYANSAYDAVNANNQNFNSQGSWTTNGHVNFDSTSIGQTNGNGGANSQSGVVSPTRAPSTTGNDNSGTRVTPPGFSN